MSSRRSPAGKKCSAKPRRIPREPVSAGECDLKITVVGDSNVGKTCLLYAFVDGIFLAETVPTLFENTRAAQKIKVDGREHRLNLWDTTGEEHWADLRKLVYPNTKIVILCYAIDNRESFRKIRSLWSAELSKELPNAKIVLVGTKIDLRVSASSGSISPSLEEPQHVSPHEGRALSKSLRCWTFLECSSLTLEGVKAVFEEATRADRSRKRTKKEHEKCCIF